MSRKNEVLLAVDLRENLSFAAAQEERVTGTSETIGAVPGRPFSGIVLSG
jgi:hypothetical protein